MVLLGLGSNLGDRLAHLQQACDRLGYPILQKSPIYETQPVDYLNQPWFFNAVIEIETNDPARALLERCRQTEDSSGRERTVLKGPRTLDIDILFYNDLILDTEDLMLPHPGIPHRRFVLVPLNDLAPKLIHPVFGRSIEDLLRFCTDPSEVRLAHAEW